MTEKEKLLAGKIYDQMDPELVQIRNQAHALCQQFNALSDLDPKRNEILKELLGNIEETAFIQGPIQFDYGKFTSFGKNSFANFNLTVLDCNSVTIKDNVFMGPNVSLYTALHPLRYQDRNMYYRKDGIKTDKEYAFPIVIESNCWIGGSVTICGGVTIGEGSVIGAGSVVLKDIPPHVIAAGVPCKVIREITEADSLENHPELFAQD